MYTVSGVLFAIAYHKIRPLTKFGKASDIPKNFIRDKVKQIGIVERIEPSQNLGALLMVNHRPPIRLPFMTKERLPVRISGITVNANGYSWLQTILENKKIVFIPISNENEKNAECQILYYDKAFNKERFRKVDIAEALLSLGFARFAEPKLLKELSPVENKELVNYYKKLATIENRAKYNGEGLWANTAPPIWPVKVLQQYWKSLIFRMTPMSRRLPELVR